MRINNIQSRIPITKGWSGDKKYKVECKDGNTYFLRISTIDKYEQRKELYELLKRIEELNVPMSKTVEFGICDEGVYLLQTWVHGIDANECISTMTNYQQYQMGYAFGEALRELHSIPSPENINEWNDEFTRVIDNKLKRYKSCGLKFEGDESVITYIENQRHLLYGRPQCFQHGDYHIGNMMVENGEAVIIDFDRYSFGDPWQEFNRIVWSAQESAYFATGQINGYFRNEVPQEFFELLKLYIFVNMLSSIYWAIPYGDKQVDVMMNQSQDVLAWYDNMQNPIPSWYISDLKF